jgi:predicted Fe-Mo cluster-binding NifX family protein
MKIAFTAKNTDWDAVIDSRFGRTNYFVIYDEETRDLSFINNRDVQSEAHGAGPRTAQRFIESGVSILITGNGPGDNAAGMLTHAGVKVYIGAGGMNVKEAYQAYLNNKLKQII